MANVSAAYWVRVKALIIDFNPFMFFVLPYVYARIFARSINKYWETAYPCL